MNQEQIQLLLLDDDDYYRRSMAATLRNLFGFLVDEAADERSAMDQMSVTENRYDVVLVDQRLADGRDGVSVMADIRRVYPEIECIILTGYAPEDRERALTAGAFRYVEKLFVNHNELSLLIRAAVQQARMRALGRDILSQLEQDDILHRALSAARMLETDNTAIALYDPEAARWDWFRQLPSSDELDRSPFPAGDRLADGIYQDSRPVIVSDLRSHLDYAALAQQGVASLAAVPVPDARGPLGVLLACSDRPGHYNAERLSWLNELAANAGMALENARTYRQTRDLAKYMAALTAISLKLTQTTEQGKLLRLVWEFVDKELNVATFFVALYDRETDEIAYPIVWDEGESKKVPTFKLADDNGLTAHVIRSGEGLYWPTIDEKERYCKTREITLRTSGRPCHSCLLLPLLAGGRVIGAMSVQSYEDYAFSYEFRTVFQALSNQLAAVLENVSLIGEVSRRADDLETLQALSIDIASSLEIDVVGTRICEAAVDLFKANHSGLLLFGEGDKMGRVVAEYPPANALGKEVPIEGVPDEQSLIRGRNPLAIECVEERKELGPVRAILRDLGIQATLIAPVIAAGRLLGSFSIDYDHRRPFSKKDVENARMFAAQVAVALDHAHHYESATRNASQVRLLHTISDLIQMQTISENEQDDIFHMVLTGITAGFGLRFNAAALFLLDGNEFVGRLGIGHFAKKEAEVDWSRDEEQARNKFDHYHERLRRGEFRKDRTPLDRAVRGTHWPNGGAGLLFDALRKSQASVIEAAERRDLPQQFIDAFQPAFPLAIAPLTARGQVIGFLAADNRFTDQPVTQALQDSLEGFANSTAMAIDNSRLHLETQRLVERLDHSWEMSTDVAGAIAREDLEATMMKFADGVLMALKADIVTIYAYDDQIKRFTLGFDATYQSIPNSIRKPDQLSDSSVIYDIIRLDDEPRYRFHDVDHPNPDLIRGTFVKKEGIKASIGIQLRGREGPLGVMFVNYRMPHLFDADELTSIQRFAKTAAAVIYSLNQYHHATHRAHVLRALNDATQLISGAETLEKTLEQIAVQAMKVTEASNDKEAACHVALKYGDTLQFAAAYPPEALTRLLGEIRSLRLDGEDRVGIIGRVAITGESINCPNAPDHQDYIRFATDTRSELAVPMKDETGAVIGVINLEHSDSGYFSDEGAGTVESLAALAAVAVRNAQNLERKETLAEISVVVNASRTLDEFLEKLFKQLKEVFDRRNVEIYPTLGIYDPQSKQLRILESAYFPGGPRTTFIGLGERGIIPLVAHSRKSYYAPDVSDDSNYYRLLPQTRSEFATPVFYHGELLAVLDLESSTRNAFTPDDRGMLETLAHQVATTIHNVNQNEALLRARTAAGAKTAMEYTAMVAGQWNHHVRNRAQTILEQTDMLRHDLERLGVAQGTIAERMTRITRKAGEIHHRPIDEPLHLEKGVSLEPVNALLRDTVNSLTADWPQSETTSLIDLNLSYDAGDNDCIAVNRKWFRVVVEHILFNAVQYADHVPKPRIDISVRRAGNKVSILVADNGPGFTSEMLRSAPGEPLKKKEDEPGLGMGLFMSHMIMYTYQGEITLANNESGGATVTLEFPLRSLSS